MSSKMHLDQPANYQIRVQGTLAARWAEYFEEMQITLSTSPDGGEITTLTGCLNDQAALQGVLQKLYNLGFPLLLVEKLEDVGPPGSVI